MSTSPAEPQSGPRLRMTREQRRAQLIAVSWRIVQSEGADALTLGRLAEQAGVAKPVVYDHFGARNGLLAALYHDYDQRHAAIIAEAVAAAPATLADKARVLADAYVDCMLSQEEIFGVAAALEGSQELGALKRACDASFLDMCKSALDPYAKGGVKRIGLTGAFGAGEALSYAAAAGDVSADEAKREFADVIRATVERGSGR